MRISIFGLDNAGAVFTGCNASLRDVNGARPTRLHSQILPGFEWVLFGVQPRRSSTGLATERTLFTYEEPPAGCGWGPGPAHQGRPLTGPRPSQVTHAKV